MKQDNTTNSGRKRKSMDMLRSNRPAIDNCNICGKVAKLTEDHVPPKFWNNEEHKKYSQGLGAFDPEYAKAQFPWNAPNGLVYRSICSDCNNRILGDETDKPLKEFCDAIKKNLQFRHKYFNCRIKPNCVARAVVGHMLAAKDFYDSECIIDQKLREYVLNPTALPPSDMQLLYFLYPYGYTVIGRDIVVGQCVPRLAGARVPEGTLSCIYAYPVGLLLVERGADLHLKDMFTYCSDAFDEEKEVLCKLDSLYYYGTNVLRDPFWPMNISDQADGISFLLGGASMRSLRIGVEK